MGPPFRVFLPASKLYVCGMCHTHLTVASNLKSRKFNGRTGRAFLFSKVVNVLQSQAERRHFTTGGHVVADVRCVVCEGTLGWKYLEADEEEQKYKEGMFILEKARIVKVELEAQGDS